MKPQLTLAVLLLYFVPLAAQVKFKVKLLTDNVTYQVLIKPDATWSAPFNAVPSAQVTLKVPTGGFSVGTVTSLAGNWSHTGTVVAPIEAPGYDYINFGLQGVTAAISFQTGVEVPIFNFTNAGGCTGALELLVNNTDPFWPPNSQSINVGNAIFVVGAGVGVNAYTGNYNVLSADCEPSSDCGIEVFDIDATAPSACGVADGSIEIVATNSNGLPIQYSINNGVTWQNSPIFNNLAAGDLFQIIIRDVAAICVHDAGDFELDGPLAAIVQNVALNQPTCGGSDGSITITAISANGGTLEYAMSLAGPWQSSSTFSGLAQGIYTFYVQDIVNNCQGSVGTYSLDGCQPENCLITYSLVDLSNGRFGVNMLTDTTWNFPNNITSSLQVSIKVPTGGFSVSNLTSQVAGVNFSTGSTYIAPAEEPGSDYISFILASPGTQGIPYVEGNTVQLFTFENNGTCSGDSIRLIQEDDPFFPPNSQNANVGQQITVSGYGGADIPVCLGTNAVACANVPPPAPTCLITYEIEKLASDEFQVSMIADTTWAFPNNITSSMNFTVKVPTGGFVASNLTSKISNVNFGMGATDVAPVEDPQHDYISFNLTSPGTQLIPYTKDVKTPLFTFKNTGTCQGGQVFLMDNDTDPFFPPNSANSNVGQQITVSGYGGADAPVCISNLPAEDCTNDPCANLAPGFLASDACEGTAIAFNNTTTSTETITSWNWDFGDNNSSTEESPSHTYVISGNFEVSLTVTTQSGCSATVMDFVTVFPTPGDAPVSQYTTCNGVAVTLQSPDNITTAVWSPDTGLSDANSANPVATPLATTVYTLTVTNSSGCQSTSQVTVTVANKPVFTDVVATPQSDCGVQDASIMVNATGTGSLEYSIDNINWQPDPLFPNLAAGSYNVFVRNADDSCPSAYNGNPVVISGISAPSISSVTNVQPATCNGDGAITINATGGTAPLQYSINGGQSFQASNVFSGLSGGTYQIVVANANGSCEVTSAAVTLTEPTPPTIAVAQPNITACVGEMVTATVQFSTAISSYTISNAFTNPVANGNTLTFNLTANAAGTSTYTVELTSANGCDASTNFTLTGVPVPSVSFTTSPTLCTNGEVTLNFTGNTSVGSVLTWDLDGGTTTFTSQQTANAPAGAIKNVVWTTSGQKSITLTVNDQGCINSLTTSINIADFNPGAALATTPASCGLSNGSIDLSLSGAGIFAYLWNNSATTQDLSNLAGGIYQVTITETGSGCSTTASATVAASQPVSIVSLVDDSATDCTGGNPDGSLEVQINGGTAPFEYNLYLQPNTSTAFDQIANNQTTVLFDGLPAGAYQLEVVDNNGCTDVQSVAIDAENSEITTVLTVVDADCDEDNGSFSLNITAGQAPFQYDFYQNGVPVGTGIPINNLPLAVANLEPSSNVIIVTDANGCIKPVVVNIDRKEASFTIAGDVLETGCGTSNGSISLTNLPMGATLAWTNQAGMSLGASNPLQNLPIGVYNVTVTDAGGCTKSQSFPVSAADGPQITLDATTPDNCGNGDGTMTFTVTDVNSFSYVVLNSGNPGSNGSADNPITINNLPGGTHVLEVSNLLQPSCKSYLPFTISGGGQILTSTTVVPSSGCGVEDGEICIEITGGVAPFTITSNEGAAPTGTVASEACVTNLYDGLVEITIVDAAGCEKQIVVDFGTNESPSITADSIVVTSPTCPGEYGSIVSNTNRTYKIFNSANTFVAETPWTQATPGTYRITFETDDCTAELTGVVITGPAAWVLTPTSTPESCTVGGSIELEIEGGTAPYAVNWNNGDTGTSLTDLSAGVYAATITDDAGCTTTVSGISVGTTCLPNPCAEEMFSVDTFNILLTAALTEVCLPTEIVDISTYGLDLNDEAYDREIGQCEASTKFYGVSTLPTAPPYQLKTWSINGNDVEEFDFNSIGDLVDQMNDLDPTGNWVYNPTLNSINGGAQGSNYGALVIFHIGSNNTLTLQPNTSTIAHPSIFVDDERQVHVFIATNPATGCSDTLYINFYEPAAPQTDSISVEVVVGSSETVCIPLDELPGIPESLSNDCISFTNNAQINNLGDECVEVVGVEEGPDQACMVICDDLGNCDTLVLLINVVNPSSELVIYNGFSPNNDGVNEHFRIKNIELYPNNNLIIFNRYGNSVFSTKGYTNAAGWRGNYYDQQLPDGTYFYILDVEIDGKMQKRSGYVQILR